MNNTYQLSRSVRRHLRKEKARIRRENLSTTAAKQVIRALKARFFRKVNEPDQQKEKATKNS